MPSLERQHYGKVRGNNWVRLSSNLAPFCSWDSRIGEQKIGEPNGADDWQALFPERPVGKPNVGDSVGKQYSEVVPTP
jgi:hypothetical protein